MVNFAQVFRYKDEIFIILLIFILFVLLTCHLNYMVDRRYFIVDNLTGTANVTTKLTSDLNLTK